MGKRELKRFKIKDEGRKDERMPKVVEMDQKRYLKKEIQAEQKIKEEERNEGLRYPSSKIPISITNDFTLADGAYLHL